MLRAQGVVRRTAARGTLAAWLLLAGCPDAFALNPALDISQYAHTSWKIRDGFFKGIIRAIVQTPDGYLWVGTEFGLLRFDGVTAVPWPPPLGQHLPSDVIWSLLTSRDGTLWIGTSNGLASWKGGRLTQYPELAGRYIFRLLQDHEGTVWVSGGRVPIGRLCAIRDGSVRCSGDDGGFGVAVVGLYEDAKRNLWLGVNDGLWRWRPAPPQFRPVPGASDGIQSFSEGDHGALLFGTGNGIRRLADGKIESYLVPDIVNQFGVRGLLRDRDGGLWIGTSDRGLVHRHLRRTDVFTQSDGLSGNHIYALFEDREGNIWVSTSGGLDRFREFAVATSSVSQGLSSADVSSVLAATDGSVWIGTSDGLNRWNNGEMTIYRGHSARAMTGVHAIGAGLPEKGVESIFRDGRGRIYVSTSGGVGYLDNDRFISLAGTPGSVIRSIVEDARGNLWIANQGLGLVQLLGNGGVQQRPWARLGRKDFGSAVVADLLRGGLWIGFFQGGVAYFVDGEVRESYAAVDGLGEGRVNHLQLDRDGTLWAAAEGGLSRLKNGRVATLTSRNGLPCDAVHWVIEDNAHAFWLYMACGLVRVARAELDGWTAAVDRDHDVNHAVHATVFDSSDGVTIRPIAAGYSPQVAKASDGRLWFPTSDGISVVDPGHIPFNSLPPPVQIEQIIADHRTYDVASDAVHLPALTRDLQIDYTALSLVASEKMRFRYKLEGYERDWHDVGTRRQAFYNDLRPRSYRFRVIASNNSGVWNETGASLNFSVAPAYYQTDLFRLLSVLAMLTVLAAVVHLRSRQVARQINMRMEERVNERTRIARDLHDTLLQSFHGVLLRFQAVTYLLPGRPAEAQTALDAAIEQAGQAITEGRDAVQGLRPSAVVRGDFAGAMGVLGDELARQIGSNPPGFRVEVEGTPRDLAPLIGDEVYRIAVEALRNAFHHANAKRIEVEVHYDRREFRLRIRDDGKGIDPKVLAGGGAAGHFGLAGMHERAAIVGGTLTIWSELDSGTEAELIITASIAYAKSSAAQGSTTSEAGT
jgi:ligand-binding sensor domain-containing protein/signal transduction histidine kinase